VNDVMITNLLVLRKGRVFLLFFSLKNAITNIAKTTQLMMGFCSYRFSCLLGQDAVRRAPEFFLIAFTGGFAKKCEQTVFTRRAAQLAASPWSYNCGRRNPI